MISHDEDIPQGKPEMRIGFLRFFFIIVFILYGMRLFNMQILSSEQYQAHAQDISRRTEVLPPQRGEIYDRSYTEPLVLNTDSFAVSIVPAEVPAENIPDLITDVAAVLNISASDIEARIPPHLYRLYQPVEIAVNVPFATIAALAERRESLPGVSWYSKPLRNYEDLGSLSHIVGYVGEITRDELMQLHNYGYQQGELIGKMGIELQYDGLLRGKPGMETRTVDVRGRRMPGLGERIPPEMGKNLVLTIDRRIQKLAEEALGERMGAVVVLRPGTGEILAIVSYPWYDPNIFTQGGRSEFQQLINDPNRPFINRAIQSSYPPASTFKIVMATGMLNENAIPLDRGVDCSGEIQFGNRTWRCHWRWGHGRLNLYNALVQSCNIYFWQVGRDNLGVENIIAYSRDFGLGAVTGIDLPGETAGFIPTPQWKSRRFHERWVAGDTMNMSIGQGWVQVTPLQLANVVAMVVNGGKIYQPHLLKEVRDPVTNEIEREVTPTLIHTSDVEPRVFDFIRRNMRGVFTDGTARTLHARAVQIAGKTGTGEVGLQDRWHSWFAAYAPYNSSNPDEQVVVSVIVEATNRWEWWASYASTIIFQGIFANQTYDEALQVLGWQHLDPNPGRRE
ncbi:MAG: penicillin-binding protein 2 [Treponema sp.]|nr:penicillin-binding protein 2 [Treponema sp.]